MRNMEMYMLHHNIKYNKNKIMIISMDAKVIILSMLLKTSETIIKKTYTKYKNTTTLRLKTMLCE